MTDYEKKYKEMKARVLEIGRGYAKGVDYSKPRQIAEYIDPELKESEDEKTRKDIVAAVETYGDFTQGRKEEIYAWLEKQCEQKPVECIKLDNEFENQISHIIASVLNGEHEYNKGFVKYASQSLLGFAKKEHKPAEWSEEDEKNCQMLQKIICDSDITEKMANKLSYWLKSIKPNHWKPSKEQMYILQWLTTKIEMLRQEIINKWREDSRSSIDDGFLTACSRFLDVITSLQQEQPKMDIDKELISYYNEHFSPCENGVLLSEESGRELDCNDYESIARHFYELGLKAKKEE